MAASTPISGARPQHRSARLGDSPHQGALALDWPNGQTFTFGAAAQASNVFDANNDRIVVCSSDIGAYITVGTAAQIAGVWAGTIVVPPGGVVEVYVPAGLRIGGGPASLGFGSAGDLYMIPALLTGN